MRIHRVCLDRLLRAALAICAALALSSAPAPAWADEEAAPAVDTAEGAEAPEAEDAETAGEDCPPFEAVGIGGWFSSSGGAIRGSVAAIGEQESALDKLDAVFGVPVTIMAVVMFADLLPGPGEVPFIVIWLFIGAVFLTVRMGFINIRGFRHAIDVVRGTYDNPDDEGEVSHFQALASALSATVGLGNIAGVAIAVSVGGPGAIFWMIVAALFGMTAKFTECTLGQKYRVVDEEGAVSGGPMRYLKAGLEEKGMSKLGAALSVIFAVFCIGGSFGGGNMFQANQAYSAVNESLVNNTGITEFPSWIFGICMAAAVAVVILGGIKRIASTAEKIVPAMCGMYLVAALFIVFTNISQVPHAIDVILSSAFGKDAMCGGMIGAMIQGIRRAAFSNEAGVGSASIAHSAAKTEYPVREGLVALLEPFIDTIIVCFATGIVIVVSGVLEDPTLADGEAAVLTLRAFEQTISWFPLVLTLAIVLFAFSTMISWSYYGERCWTNLFGAKSALSYRIVFIAFVFIGSVIKLGNVIDFSDLMILSMAFPNILGLYILSSDVRADLDAYMAKLRSGEMKRYDG